MRDKLKDYNRKRDFSKTKEPSGKLTPKKGKKLIFVVQEHHASHLHYDFRLELEGVLKSWAVPKGPSMDPADKRLAVMTEDHPYEYAKFEGKIPKGEYGGGEVIIWDTGTWEPMDADPVGALAKGRLEFSLKGKRLSGKFLLVRTSKNWLLMKRHDEKEKVIKGDPWPGFIKPQLPRLVTDPPDGKNWVHEMKFDGYRMQALLKNGVGNLFSRNGLDWSNNFPFILEELNSLKLQNAIIDGEVVALDEEGRSVFQRLQNSLKAKDDRNLRYHVFDILYLDGKDLRPLPLLERKAILEKLLKKTKHVLFSEHIFEAGDSFYKVSCQHKLEGMVSKQADAPYVSGRGDTWVKTKCGARQEFVIGGWTDPRGSRTGIGALLLGVYKGNDLTYAGRVGTGMDTRTLRELKRILGALEVDESPFDKKSPRGSDIHWVKPEQVCEVAFSEWTSDEILRTPVFKGLRVDKPAKQILREKAGKKVKGPEKPAKASKREISSPDKILYEKEKITKGQVADYYEEVAKIMLPYMKDRPLSLVRCPNGTSGQHFFQKHFPGQLPEGFNAVPIQEEDGEGIYISVDSAKGLRELVQLNAFEIHAWGCHQDKVEWPDQIVMDLDPGEGVPWEQVVEGAFEIKDILETLGLESFVKLTGGKGIHVHVPVAPVYDWDQIKAFSQSLALELQGRSPSLYLANMSKKLRKNKIFVDYLRNGRGATAVAPYSLRARELSTVALPLEWPELRKVKSPTEYTLVKALKKIRSRKRDPWARMRKLKQRIPILKPKLRAA